MMSSYTCTSCSCINLRSDTHCAKCGAPISPPEWVRSVVKAILMMSILAACGIILLTILLFVLFFVVKVEPMIDLHQRQLTRLLLHQLPGLYHVVTSLKCSLTSGFRLFAPCALRNSLSASLTRLTVAHRMASSHICSGVV